MPRLSVIMSVYNDANFLPYSIESILNQSFSDFEFIIVDDGSTDLSSNILAHYEKLDSRICVIRQENTGLTAALNVALKKAGGEYVARMDADDVSLPERFATQVAFLDANSEIGVVGSCVLLIEDGPLNGQIRYFPADDATIRCQMLFHNPLVHPTVMLRKAVFDQNGLHYDPSFLRSQDYDLWERASAYTRFANITQPLLNYQVHDRQISKQNQSEQNTFAAIVRTRMLEHLGLAATPIHEALANSQFGGSQTFVTASEAWLRKLRDSNRRNAIFPQREFSAILGTYWLRTCNSAASLGLWTWLQFIKSPLNFGTNRSWRQRLRLARSCLRR
jgi:glycosyltransferase involved in cell wall biosynthesis